MYNDSSKNKPLNKSLFQKEQGKGKQYLQFKDNRTQSINNQCIIDKMPVQLMPSFFFLLCQEQTSNICFCY